MDKTKAISECKELWKEIEESGLTKYGFFDSPAGKKWRGKHYRSYCPLCDYAAKMAGFGDSPVCESCPFITQYGKDCFELGFNDTGYSLPSFFDAVRGLTIK